MATTNELTVTEELSMAEMLDDMLSDPTLLATALLALYEAREERDEAMEECLHYKNLAELRSDLLPQLQANTSDDEVDEYVSIGYASEQLRLDASAFSWKALRHAALEAGKPPVKMPQNDLGPDNKYVFPKEAWFDVYPEAADKLFSAR